MNSRVNDLSVESVASGSEFMKPLSEMFPDEISQFLINIKKGLNLEDDFDFSSIDFNLDKDICEDGISLQLNESGKRKLIEFVTLISFENKLKNEGEVSNDKTTKLIYIIQRASQEYDEVKNEKSIIQEELNSLSKLLTEGGDTNDLLQEKYDDLNEKFNQVIEQCITASDILNKKNNDESDYLQRCEFFKNFVSNYEGYITFSNDSAKVGMLGVINDSEIEALSKEEKNIERYISLLNKLLNSSYLLSKESVSGIQAYALPIQEEATIIESPETENIHEENTISISDKINDFIEENKKMVRVIVFTLLGVVTNYVGYSSIDTKDIPFNTDKYKDQSFLKAQVENFIKESVINSNSLEAIGYNFKKNLMESNLFSRSTGNLYSYEVISSNNLGIEISFTEKNHNNVFFTYKYLFTADINEVIQEKEKKILKRYLYSTIDESIGAMIMELDHNFDTFEAKEYLSNKIFDGISSIYQDKKTEVVVGIDFILTGRDLNIKVVIKESTNEIILIEYEKVHNIINNHIMRAITTFENEQMSIVSFPNHFINDTTLFGSLSSFIKGNLLPSIQNSVHLVGIELISILSADWDYKGDDNFTITFEYNLEGDENIHTTDVKLFVDMGKIYPIRKELKTTRRAFSDVVDGLAKNDIKFNEKTPNLHSYILNKLQEKGVGVKEDHKIYLKISLQGRVLHFRFSGKIPFKFPSSGYGYSGNDIFDNYMNARLMMFEDLVIKNISIKQTLTQSEYLRLFVNNLNSHLLKYFQLNKTSYDKEVTKVEIINPELRGKYFYYETLFTYGDKSIDKKIRLRKLELGKDIYRAYTEK